MDLKIEVTRMRDVQAPQRDGVTVDHYKEATFFIGKFGPFVERLPLDTYDTELTARVAKLKATLENLPK